MVPSFSQLEDLIARLPIDEDNYWIFERLIEQPYDVYRPIMDMLFDGTIVVEDLTIPPGVTAGSILQDARAAKWRLDSYSVSDVGIQGRCLELIASGRAGSTVIGRDTSALSATVDGSIGAFYGPKTQTAVGGDSTVITPNPIELARAGSLVDAQKAIQEDFFAATEPDME